jgi:hypothetical protein
MKLFLVFFVIYFIGLAAWDINSAIYVLTGLVVGFGVATRREER